MLTDEQLQAIEARAKAATRGQWYAYGSEVRCDTEDSGDLILVEAFRPMGDHPDIEFIARAHEDVPALLAEVRRLREPFRAKQPGEHRSHTEPVFSSAWNVVPQLEPVIHRCTAECGRATTS